MSVLFIGPDETARIAEAIAKARENATPWEVLSPIADGTSTNHLDLSERKPGVESIRRQYPPQQVMLGTYRAALSFELQPAGMFRHLSISSANKGKVPGLEVVTAVVEAFGFSGWPLQRPNRVWIEEFEPGWHAVNILELEAAAN